MATAIVKRNDALTTLRDTLARAQGQIAAVAAASVTPERMTRVALACAARTPKLLECDVRSIVRSVMQSAELGLEAGSALGHAYLVPYKDQCQLIIGYRGLLELARRSGQIKQISAHVVRERDRFDVRFGTSESIEHTPLLGADAGEIVAVYAVAHLTDGSVQSEVMSRAEVDAIRSRSRASSSGPWVTDYAEMARKTVLRRLCKYLPSSTLIAKALEVEDSGQSDETVSLAPSASDRLRAAVVVQQAVTSEPAIDADTGEVTDTPEREPGSDG